MAIPSPWLVTNLDMYGTPPICTVIFSIGDSVELVKLGLLPRFHAQLYCLVAWKVLKTHQETYHRSYHNVILQW